MSWLSNDERQAITLKIGYADEDANETYLGLTNADFEVDPDTRYPASALDNFVSKHHQFHLNYGVQFDPSFQLNVKPIATYFKGHGLSSTASRQEHHRKECLPCLTFI